MSIAGGNLLDGRDSDIILNGSLFRLPLATLAGCVKATIAAGCEGAQEAAEGASYEDGIC